VDRQRGDLVEGKLADIMVWQPERFADNKSWSKYASMNPFARQKNFGAIKAVYLRGSLVFDNGKFLDPKGQKIRPLHIIN
jgi:dihydroorotase-like cyclic amidohydrolase